jgi:hypothetical protein
VVVGLHPDANDFLRMTRHKLLPNLSKGSPHAREDLP